MINDKHKSDDQFEMIFKHYQSRKLQQANKKQTVFLLPQEKNNKICLWYNNTDFVSIYVTVVITYYLLIRISIPTHTYV